MRQHAAAAGVRLRRRDPATARGTSHRPRPTPCRAGSRSMRASTSSPGSAPADQHDGPLGAREHPAAGHRLLDAQRHQDRPGWHGRSDGRSPAARTLLADQAGPWPRSAACRYASADIRDRKRLELAVGLRRQRVGASIGQARADGARQSTPIGLGQRIQDALALIASCVFRRWRSGSRARTAPPSASSCGAAQPIAAAQYREPRQHRVEVRLAASVAAGRPAAGSSTGGPPSASAGDDADADRAPPLVEGVEHVGLAELHAHRPPARSLAVVALEVPVDAGPGHLQRDALVGPAHHPLERRPDDADQVTVVLAAQVRLDLAAVGACSKIAITAAIACDRAIQSCHCSSPAITRSRARSSPDQQRA